MIDQIIKQLNDNLNDAHLLTAKILQDQEFIKKTAQATGTLIESLQSGGIVYTCGNGGSMCDAIHFAEEMTGRLRDNRDSIGAIAISDPGHISCVANDFGYDFIFSRFIEGVAKSSDILVGITTSGNSANVLKGFEAAKAKGMKTIGLLGKDGGKAKDLVDHALIVPHYCTNRIQEVHIKLIHNLIEGVERIIHPQNYS